MCQTFIPILRKNGRIVNVSSIGSTLKLYSDDLKKRFRSSELTLQALEDMIVSYQVCCNQRSIRQRTLKEYQACVDHSTESQNGWPVNRQSYSVSKASINALTAILARENPEVFINACCPGWVSTDMGKMVGTPTKHPGKTELEFAWLSIADVLSASTQLMEPRYRFVLASRTLVVCPADTGRIPPSLVKAKDRSWNGNRNRVRKAFLEYKAYTVKR